MGGFNASDANGIRRGASALSASTKAQNSLLFSNGHIMPRVRFFVILAACFLAPLPAIHASILVTDEVDPADPSTWTDTTTAYVGHYATGALTVDADSDIVSKDAYVAYGSGSNGTVVVDGEGSTWTTARYLEIGVGGEGSLSVIRAGAVSSKYGTVGGTSVGSHGSATIDGDGSTWTTDTLRVNNTGILNISSGGLVNATTTNVYAGPTDSGVIHLDNGTLATQTLYVNPSQLTGTGTIDARGLVIDGELTFDATHGPHHTIAISNQPGDNVTLDLNLTDPANVGNLGAGWQGSGSLTIRDGVTVNSTMAYLGQNAGAMGEAIVEGAGSTWNNESWFYVGFSGSGALTIRDGGTVDSGRGLVVLGGAPSNSSSTNRLTISGEGSALYAKTLSVGDWASGVLNIRDSGSASVDYCYIASPTASGLISEATIDGTGSTLTCAKMLGIGGTFAIEGNCGGKLNIINGGVVNTGYCDINYLQVSPPLGETSVNEVTVAGAGSALTATDIVTLYGGATLNIVSGGSVTSREGQVSGGTSKVTIAGAGSRWDITGDLSSSSTITGSVSCTMRIASGALLTDDNALVTSSGWHVTVDGAGSRWTNSGGLTIDYGKVSILGGGAVTAQSVSASNVYNSYALTIDVGNGSSLVVGDGSGAITGGGKIYMVAGPRATAGEVYQPILAGAYGTDSSYKPIGGTWNTSTHAFTASAVEPGTAGTQVSIDLHEKQRIEIDDSATEHSLAASFLPATSSKTLAFTATPLSGATLTSLESLLDPTESVLAAWQCALTGYTNGELAYLSFNVGDAYNANDLTVWRGSGSTWYKLDADILTRNGDWASFSTTTLAGFTYANYAITAVPEPGTLALLIVALGLVASVRLMKKVKGGCS